MQFSPFFWSQLDAPFASVSQGVIYWETWLTNSWRCSRNLWSLILLHCIAWWQEVFKTDFDLLSTFNVPPIFQQRVEKLQPIEKEENLTIMFSLCQFVYHISGQWERLAFLQQVRKHEDAEEVNTFPCSDTEYLERAWTPASRGGCLLHKKCNPGKAQLMHKEGNSGLAFCAPQPGTL